LLRASADSSTMMFDGKKLIQVGVVVAGSAFLLTVLVVPPLVWFVALVGGAITFFISSANLTFSHPSVGKWPSRDLTALSFLATVFATLSVAFPFYVSALLMMASFGFLHVQTAISNRKQIAVGPFVGSNVSLLIFATVAIIILCFEAPLNVSLPLSLSCFAVLATFVSCPPHQQQGAIMISGVIMLFDLAWLIYLYVPRNAVVTALAGIMVAAVAFLQTEGAMGFKREVLVAAVLTLTVSIFSYLTFSFSVFAVLSTACVLISLILASPEVDKKDDKKQAPKNDAMAMFKNAVEAISLLYTSFRKAQKN